MASTTSIREHAAVRVSAASIASRNEPDNGRRSPSTRKRISLRCIFAASSRSAASINSISTFTSCGGRRQFSVLNAYRLSVFTPRCAQAVTTRSTANRPALCPNARGRRCCCAQRPLPSMMMATWAGGGSVAAIRPPSVPFPFPTTPYPPARHIYLSASGFPFPRGVHHPRTPACHSPTA